MRLLIFICWGAIIGQTWTVPAHAQSLYIFRETHGSTCDDESLSHFKALLARYGRVEILFEALPYDPYPNETTNGLETQDYREVSVLASQLSTLFLTSSLIDWQNLLDDVTSINDHKYTVEHISKSIAERQATFADYIAAFLAIEEAKPILARYHFDGLRTYKGHQSIFDYVRSKSFSSWDKELYTELKSIINELYEGTWSEIRRDYLKRLTKADRRWARREAMQFFNNSKRKGDRLFDARMDFYLFTLRLRDIGMSENILNALSRTEHDDEAIMVKVGRSHLKGFESVVNTQFPRIKVYPLNCSQ